jgi:hypothetical protein
MACPFVGVLGPSIAMPANLVVLDRLERHVLGDRRSISAG